MKYFPHAGDEVIEWNGRPLHNRTAQDVYDIIADSRTDPQVELIVSRPITAVNRKTVQESWRQSHSPTRVQAQRRGSCNINVELIHMYTSHRLN